jgi:hypothetical protein
MAKRTEPIQIVDGSWYAIAFGQKPFTEECCDCGLVHITDFKVENGKFWVRYRRDDKSTAAARVRMVKKGQALPELPEPHPRRRRPAGS